MQKLIIWGAGGHGKVVLDVARAAGLYDEIVFVDDSCAVSGGSFCNCELLPSPGGFEVLKAHGHSLLIVAIGNNRVREKLLREGIDRGFHPAVLVHPTAVVATSAQIGAGTILMPRVVLNADAVVGRNCILNSGAIIEHDCRVGDHAHIGPGVLLAGGVIVESHSFLGAGSIALPYSRIGEGAVVGAGAVVLDVIPPGAIAVGVPAKVLSYVSDGH